MFDETIAQLPPLQGCLYCHAEGTTFLVEPRKILGLGSSFSVLKCSQCDSVALFDAGDGDEDGWRIRYRRANRAPRYYYVAVHLGKIGWVPAREALAISTDGFVQRKRVQQVKEGSFDWLQPAPLRPPPPLMSVDEQVFLTLRAVSYQKVPPQGIFVRADQGEVLDSGKFYVTDQKLHLLGQRRDWSHRLGDIEKIDYNDRGWAIFVRTTGQLQQYRGFSARDQMDAQLVSTIVETLWRLRLMETEAF